MRTAVDLQSCTCEAGRRDGNGSGIRVGSSQDGCGAKAEEEKVRCESFDARGWMRGGKVNSLIKLKEQPPRPQLPVAAQCSAVRTVSSRHSHGQVGSSKPA